MSAALAARGLPPSAWFEGARAWPDLTVTEEVFRSYLAERAPDPGAAQDFHVADLFLACACSLGDSRALASFETLHFHEVDRAFARMGHLEQTLDDVKQLVRMKLFLGVAGSAPKIREYSGRGTLKSWMRVVVMRLLLNLVAGNKREIPVEDSLFAALPSALANPEMEHLKRRYRDEFGICLASVVRGLPKRDRHLLLYGVVEQRSIDFIASIYQVHRATAARWLVKTRERLLTELRQALRERFSVDEAELEAIFSLVQSRLDVSLRGLLSHSM